jgi:hypothetical protein
MHNGLPLRVTCAISSVPSRRPLTPNDRTRGPSRVVSGSGQQQTPALQKRSWNPLAFVTRSMAPGRREMGARTSRYHASDAAERQRSGARSAPSHLLSQALVRFRSSSRYFTKLAAALNLRRDKTVAKLAERRLIGRPGAISEVRGAYHAATLFRSNFSRNSFESSWTGTGRL